MVTELSSGPFIALEIGDLNPNVHPYQNFRQLCGPFDPVSALVHFKICSIHRKDCTALYHDI